MGVSGKRGKIDKNTVLIRILGKMTIWGGIFNFFEKIEKSSKWALQNQKEL